MSTPTVKPRNILNAITGTKTESPETPFSVDAATTDGQQQDNDQPPPPTQQNGYLSRRTSLTKIAAHLGFDQPEYLAVLLNLLDMRHKKHIEDRKDALSELKIHLGEIAELAGI